MLSTPPARLAAPCLLAFALSFGLTGSAQAQAPATSAKAEARRLLREGTRAFDQNNFPKALERFEKALQVFPSARIHYNIGQTLRELKRPVEAVEAFETFLREADRITSVERRETTAALRELEPTVGRLTVTTNVADVAVTIDGRSRGKTPLAHPVVLAPGTHEMTLGRAGYRPLREKVTVAGGEQRRASFTLIEDAPPPVARVAPPPVSREPVAPVVPPSAAAPPPVTYAPPPSIYEGPVTPLPTEEPRQRWSSRNVVGVSLLIASAALAAGGGVLMGSAWSRYNEAEDSCAGDDCETAAKDVESHVLWSKILFGGAALAGVSGAAVFMFPATESRPGDVGARGVMLVKQGRF